MLNNGWHGRKQILSRASIQLMKSDQLTPEQRAGSEVFFGRHGSWGFGVGVDVFRDDIFRTPGRFGWDGGLGTSAYVDPAEGMIGILMTQSLMHSPPHPRSSPISDAGVRSNGISQVLTSGNRNPGLVVLRRHGSIHEPVPFNCFDLASQFHHLRSDYPDESSHLPDDGCGFHLGKCDGLRSIRQSS